MPDIRVQDEQGKVHVFPDGSTPEMIAKAMGVKPPRAAAALQSATVKPTGVLSKLNDWWTTPQKGDPDPYTMAKLGYAPPLTESPREAAYSTAKLGMGASAPGIGSALLAAPAATLLGLGTGVAGGYAGSEVGGYLGEKVGAPELGSDIGGFGGALAGGVYGPKAINATRGLVSRAAYTPEGAVKPGVASAAQALRHPTEIPGRLATGLAGKIFPPPKLPASFTGASLPSADEFYANEAEARMRLGRQQIALDKATARTAAQQAKIPNWETPAHSEIPLGSPEYPGPFNKIPSRLPTSLRGDPFNPQPQGAVTAPRVVPFDAGEPRMTGSEGRAATWTNEAVQKLAAQGNREAIQQAVRRGMDLPPGARYVMGDPDFSRGVYNPRDVTTFTPEGQPIRNVENPNESAPRERIQVPQQSQPREVTNAATGEVTNPYVPPEQPQLEGESEAERLIRNPPSPSHATRSIRRQFQKRNR